MLDIRIGHGKEDHTIKSNTLRFGVTNVYLSVVLSAADPIWQLIFMKPSLLG
jgi:hypothetical protein